MIRPTMRPTKFVRLVATTGLLFTIFHQTQCLDLIRGYTTIKPPFVERNETTGKLKGFFVDLLDLLAAAGNFSYILSEHHVEDNVAILDITQSHPTGLINELKRQRIDFAIADHLFRTPKRERYVDFSEPYIEAAFSALVSKEQLKQRNINTFEDLMSQPPKSKNEQVDQQNKEIVLGTLRNMYSVFSQYSDSIFTDIYYRLKKYNTNLVDTRKRGVDLALTTPYAFIQESIFNELATDEHCDLTQLIIENNPSSPNSANNQNQLERHLLYSIALQQKSPYLIRINQAMRGLKESGDLHRLKHKYWNKKCNGIASVYLDKYRYYLTLFSTMASMSISLFLLN